MANQTRREQLEEQIKELEEIMEDSTNEGELEETYFNLQNLYEELEKEIRNAP